MKKLGKDLEIGDVVKELGIIMEVKIESDPDGFWSGKPYYTALDLSDSHYGPGCGQLDLDKEFEVITERRDISKLFRTVECDIDGYIADMMEVRRELGEIHSNVFKKLNKKSKEDKRQKTNNHNGG